MRAALATLIAATALAAAPSTSGAQDAFARGGSTAAPAPQAGSQPRTIQYRRKDGSGYVTVAAPPSPGASQPQAGPSEPNPAPAPAVTGLKWQAPVFGVPLVAIGLPFAPAKPQPVAASHPYYHAIEVAEIAGLPSRLYISTLGKLNLSAAAKRADVNAALGATLEKMNLRSTTGTPPRARLEAWWLGSSTPFKMPGKNASTATLRYRLVSLSDGQVLFDRQITTSAAGEGGEVLTRDNGVLRAAIATNLASAADCLQRAAVGFAPADCALTPRFSVGQILLRR